MFALFSRFPRLAALCLLITIVSSCAAMTPAPGIDVCFSPGGKCLDVAAAEIAKAKSDLRIQAYSLNAKPLADAVVRAKQAGVHVEIILDKGSSSSRNNATYFSSLNGIPTRLDGRHAVADPNVIIIDREVVLTGSFNLTKDAEDKNAENLMVIRSTSVAARYLLDWNLHHSHAEVFKQAEAQPEQNGKSNRKPARKKTKKTAKTGRG